jgi:hypothetical protein
MSVSSIPHSLASSYRLLNRRVKYNLVEFSAIPAAAVSLSLPQSTATPSSVLKTSGYSVKVHIFEDAPNFMRERERACGRESERESGNQQQQ